MSYPDNTAEIAEQLQLNLVALSSEEGRGMDLTRMLQILSGLLVETLLLFDEPDASLEAAYAKLANLLGVEPMEGELQSMSLPPSYVIDFECECGRALARGMFEDWLECEYDFFELVIYTVDYNFRQWRRAGISLAESFRMLIEFSNRCLAYEISAQELCDLVIERKIGGDGWSLGDSISGLSAMAGRRLALSIYSGTDKLVISSYDLPRQLDHMAYVMTQEAIRLGVSAGSDWRFGLAANDMPINAPVELVSGLEPHCREFFGAMGLKALQDQAVGCAKAAGRMIAVASVGELPELEPVIAKPLAMAAMTETYRSVCLEYTLISC